ncbi:MAG: uncharacterized protein JWQ97_3541 [Phenylobacterium sp.]|nr:uncharacterized protein [Phenylobacterium sp.]
MKMLTTFVAASAACVALAACQTTAQQIGSKEDLLAQAGFTVRPANTPQRQASLQQLPPNKFVQRTKNDQTQYVYADPKVCGCLYIGDAKAYGTYKNDLLIRRIASDEEFNAMNYNGAWNWDRWDWGTWGPGWWR